MNTLLTAPDIEYLLTQQEKLDSDIRGKLNISMDEWENDLNDNHIIALRVEVAEFVNEARVWKYWKKKPIDRDRIIDEAVDVIHFLMLLWNKDEFSSTPVEIVELYEMFIPQRNKRTEFVLAQMMESFNLPSILACLLFVLNDYNFTTQDILDSYNRKNAINFERLESGY